MHKLTLVVLSGSICLLAMVGCGKPSTAADSNSTATPTPPVSNPGDGGSLAAGNKGPGAPEAGAAKGGQLQLNPNYGK
jgi:hypothetical protein